MIADRESAQPPAHLPIVLPKPKNSITPTSILIKGCVYLDLLDPEPEVITIDAVAAGLEEPRWCNQTNRTITVADHLLRCARIAVAKGCTLAEVVACLLHDAAEAFLRDIPGPLKPHLRVAHGGNVLTYAEVERRMLRAICVALIVDKDLLADVLRILDDRGGVVKQVDSEALRIEAMTWLPGAADWASEPVDSRAWLVADVEPPVTWEEAASVALGHKWKDPYLALARDLGVLST